MWLLAKSSLSKGSVGFCSAHAPAFPWECDAKSILVDPIKARLQGTVPAAGTLSQAPAAGESQGSKHAVLAGIVNLGLAKQRICSLKCPGPYILK